MPVTPFHFGPGFFIKSFLRQRFSFFIFVFTQIITDIEPSYYLITRQYPIHRFAHTYLGATIVAIICAAISRPIRQLVIKKWNGIEMSAALQSMRGNEFISFQTALATALIGSYSHVALDSLMHPDIRPLYPFSTDNILFLSLSFEALHLLCVGLGIIGIVVTAIAEITKKRRKHDE